MKTSQNLVSVEQFSNQDVMAYLKLAQAFKNGKRYNCHSQRLR